MSTVKKSPPSWYSKIDFKKLESSLKSSKSRTVIKETQKKCEPTQEIISKTMHVPQEKLRELYNI